MVRQKPQECSERERPSISPGSVHPDLGRDVFWTTCGSDSSRWFCDINSLKRLAVETLRSCIAPSREMVNDWLADNPLTDEAMLGMIVASIVIISRIFPLSR